MPECSQCGKETQTQEERMDDLKVKLDEYKEKEKTRKERRDKWENWVKTQSMFYNKTSTNYQKWQYFEPDSDSDKEEKEPIVPKDDPNFKAMEADFADRKKRRLRDTKEANDLKKKGNDCLKRGLYKSAIKHYSDAIDIRKDIMALYSN
jgi:hypothetical protein